MPVRKLASWGATEKLHKEAIFDRWQVGRQRKNQQFQGRKRLPFGAAFFTGERKENEELRCKISVARYPSGCKGL